jgi:hypothetical protein
MFIKITNSVDERDETVNDEGDNNNGTLSGWQQNVPGAFVCTVGQRSGNGWQGCGRAA